MRISEYIKKVEQLREENKNLKEEIKRLVRASEYILEQNKALKETLDKTTEK